MVELDELITHSMQTLSVKCKLQVPVKLRSEIDRTLQGFADACNQILDVARRENCWNTTKLHHKVYKPVREALKLKANHVCQAIRRVIGNAKAVSQIHKFKCGHCGFEHDADINAAMNIAALGVCVSNPERPGMSCLLHGQLPLFSISQI